MDRMTDFSLASFISAPLEARESFNRPKEKEFPNASYIWPFGYERFHTFRLFKIEKAVKRVEIAFLCDNLFDVWLNGIQLAADTTHLQLLDVTKVIVHGENNLHIRAYQSGTDETFSAALTGGIRIIYADSTVEELVTDGSFKQIHMVDFWVTEEPEGFEQIKEGNISDMNVMDMHPISLRRSFYFVKDFEVKSLPVAAHLYATALGCYEPHLNGERITDSFFMPFCQNYQKEYQKFDITDKIQHGKNRIGMISGNGSYNCSSWGQLTAKIPEVMALLELTYADGRKERIFTDESWRCYPSPLVENDIQYGERYDAGLERTDWCMPSDASDFFKVSGRKAENDSFLLEQNYPLIKKMKEYPLKICKILPDGTALFDVGICIAGRVRAAFKNLPKGKKIRIRYCERLTKEGIPENGAYTTVHYQTDCAQDGRSAMFMRNMDVYFAAGREYETYECRFAYTGFRYVWVEGLEHAEQLLAITAFELHNDLEETGAISTDDSSLNQIFNATKRAWLNNLFNGPTDCPTREKNFWNGDSQIFSHAACWLTDNAKFLKRWTANGVKMHDGPYAWEDEIYEIPFTLYKFYGDKEILQCRYSAMLDLIKKRQESERMILPDGDSKQYCDWLSPGGVTPDKQFFCGCWYYHMLVRVSEIAEILGDKETASKLTERAELAKTEFNKRHLLDSLDDYDAKNQCGIVLPLAFGLAPKECEQRLADKLAAYIVNADYHVTTGFIGTRYLLDVLADYGYGEIAYKVLVNTGFPSWMHMLSTGATAITESWLGEQDPDTSLSMSHFSLGAVISWFFEYLGGIRIKESEAGLGHIVLKPIMIKELGNFAVSYKSKYGMIRTQWHYEEDLPVFTYDVPEGVLVTIEIERN